eukprot:scaffold48307_cov22-Cyclotella_meneghiniana.AAC.1
MFEKLTSGRSERSIVPEAGSQFATSHIKPRLIRTIPINNRTKKTQTRGKSNQRRITLQKEEKKKKKKKKKGKTTTATTKKVPGQKLPTKRLITSDEATISYRREMYAFNHGRLQKFIA